MTSRLSTNLRANGYSIRVLMEHIALPMHGPANWNGQKVGMYMLVNPAGRVVISYPKLAHVLEDAKSLFVQVGHL